MTEEELTIVVRPMGPYRVPANAKIVDVDGNEFKLPEGWDRDRPIALCRCGQSKMKPFCDSTHKQIDWTNTETRAG